MRKHTVNNSPSFTKFLSITRSPLFLLAIILFCCLSYFFLDRDLAIFVKHSLHGNIIYIGQLLTKLGKGNAYFVILPLLLAVFKFILKNKEWTRKCLFLLLSIIVPSILCLIIKSVLGRTRPTLFFSDDLYGFTFFQIKAPYWSFPSGHSVLITGIMLGLAFLFSRYWILFMLIALLVSFSRIVVGAHYLSDVIGGMYLSILVVPWVYAKVFYRFGRVAAIKRSSLRHKSLPTSLWKREE
jgi:membrane-associated phospholipid phosphatase